MNILLIHLSDFHFKNKEDEILDRVAAIGNAIKSRLVGIENIFIIVSGDIADSGKQEEYEIAQYFFKELEKNIRLMRESVHLYYIIVPGNHDCCFASDVNGEERKRMIQEIIENHKLINEEENLFRCAESQLNFFEWSSLIQCIEFKRGREQFVLEREFFLGDNIRLKFVGYNTAWMSLPDKYPDYILFPVQFIPHSIKDNTFDLVFSVLHHPYNWIKSDASKAFRQMIEFNSNIIITGHEHDASYHETKYLHGETRQYIQGGELQGDKESTFNTILLDVPNRRMKYTRYTWINSMYKSEEFDWADIPRSRALKQDKFVLKKSFSDFVRAPGVLFTHPRKKDLTIEDIYVFPDLEELSEKLEINLINSDRALNYLLANNRILLFGPESSGKSSLLKIMFQRYQTDNLVPLWIEGKNINTGNPEKLMGIFSEAFENEYGREYLDDFWMLESSKRVLILDDLQNICINRKAKLKLFDFIDQQFDIALISSSNIISVQDIIETVRNDFLLSCKRLGLSEFGNVGRSKLIERWLLLGQEDVVQEIQLDHDVKRIEEKAEAILRPSLAPSYPFYILTIAQSVESEVGGIPTPFSEDRGSFGFFYEWLITTSLHNSPKKIADLSAKYKYLSELSFWMFQNQRNKIDPQELYGFHNSYLQRFSLRYIDLSYDDMVSDLTLANILTTSNDYFEFRYPCIYYYFVARAMNSRLQRPLEEKQVKNIILDLVNNIDIEENESILLFLSYLSENPYVRETLLNTSKRMFAQNEPTDLDNDLRFINKERFDLALKLPDGKPKKIREKIQDREDKKRRERRIDIQYTRDDENIDEQIKSMMRAYKMVRIMGQIVKNFATSWEGEDKYSLVQESYLLGLRVLKEILTFYANTIDEFVKEVKDALKYKWEKEMLKLPPDRRRWPTDSELEIAAKAAAFILTLQVSFAGIYGIAKYIGTEKLYPTYKEIFAKYGHLISVRLIDVAIKLDCQPSLPLDTLSELLKDLERNNVAKIILRRLAFLRLTLYESDRVERQRCCQMMNIKQSDPRLFLPDKKIGKI
jgi:UDP-2,3-diacylglucosamine pyrophosphatase LpxH